LVGFAHPGGENAAPTGSRGRVAVAEVVGRVGRVGRDPVPLEPRGPLEPADHGVAVRPDVAQP